MSLLSDVLEPECLFDICIVISLEHDTARQRIEEKAVVISGNSVVLSGQSETKCVVYSWFTELNKNKDSGFI